MLHILRRVGIAIGSFVAASLVIGFVGSAFLTFFGVAFRPLDPGSTSIWNALAGLVTVVLGFLIYRDILRREEHTI